MADKKFDRRKLYFIGLLLPTPFTDEATELKQHFFKHYNSKAALNSPPHITLHMPFEWDEKKEQKLIQRLETFASTCRSVSVAFDNFGCFPPRVIYIAIKQSDTLAEMQQNLFRFCKKELNLFNANYRALPFHPHVTIAFRDLKKDAFMESWKEFGSNKFEGEFIPEALTLLKHSGKTWEVLKNFKFREEDLAS